MPHVLADEVLARGLDQVPALEVAEAVQDLRHSLRHGGLSGARVPREAHVKRRRAGLDAELAPGAVHHQQGGELADVVSRFTPDPSAFMM